MLVGANGPCRVLVDGREVGRQGGFDPYAEWDRDRLQPYDLARVRCSAGEHELRLELLALGPHPTGRAARRLGPHGRGEHSGSRPTRAGASRSTAPRHRLDLRLDQRGDPASNHAWRRPHPLPEGDWLEPGRGTADAGARVTVTADRATATAAAAPDRAARAPPRSASRSRPAAAATVRVGGRGVEARQDDDGDLHAALGEAARGPQACEITVEPAPGLAGGAVLTGPIAFTVGRGRMELIDWQEAGLVNHSGGVRYRRRLDLGPLDGVTLTLDLGDRARHRRGAGRRRQRRSARLLAVHVRPHRPAGAASVTLEVLVLNTLGPHLDAVSPTPYVFPGQRASGLLGPVRLRRGS